MKPSRLPATPAIRVLRQHQAEFTHHPYAYLPHGGTAQSACELGVEEHAVIKTLIMEDEAHHPIIVLMHGDCEVSTKNLARHIGVKNIAPCTPEVANRHSGYLVGGTSPFGTRRTMPVYLQRSILDLPRLYINGGHRGYAIAMAPAVLLDILRPELVDVCA